MGAVMTAERQEQATAENWMFPPEDGWTYHQVRDLELPFDWELVDGMIVPRGMTKLWHNSVRDGFLVNLRQARRDPYAVVSEQCVLVDEQNPPKPDVVVFDKTGLTYFDLECVPVAAVSLIIEVVSPGSRQDDRVRKPALYAQAKVPYYWRVERERDDQIAVHEFWYHARLKEYAPPPENWLHRDKLVTEKPFPVEIDLRALTDF
ncbi:Uma2 family endonuclease [Streptomyces litchfieldiae]|uniref:Uma2 family endonuclease n=1 Tax=Streptomyces litchfieldiae TaxID=3075543 RepID=A0ABU2MPE8_9ACTN|nr:Uma2 family endonuclease [Streptomyces sp. DSM 44938]MDT0343272.1 Uma2 family endonuclease [Streptomyces sp. DSM 44938]